MASFLCRRLLGGWSAACSPKQGTQGRSHEVRGIADSVKAVMVQPMPLTDADVDERIVAFLTKTQHILHSDVQFVAQQTGLSAQDVHAALLRLDAAGRVHVDAAGRWALV